MTMSDDEVKEWLSEEERRMWLQASETRKAFVDHFARTLAETRKALAAAMVRHDVHDEGPTDHCPICGHVHLHHSILPPAAHEPTCIFATMPRPKRDAPG